jgi:signal peptidase I
MANMFALILVIATLVTGLLWCLDKFIFAPKRRERQAAAQAATGDQLDKKTLKKVGPKPGWLETGASVFPVLAIVLVVRSFIYEPFQIPSGSMMPTLLIGDFILVEKFAYGIKDPIYQKTLIETGHPKRGDIVVFKYPEDPRLDYIKRAVGLPGDKVTYDPVAKQVTIQPGCSSARPAATRCRSLTPTLSRAISCRPSPAATAAKRPAVSGSCRKAKPKPTAFV